MGTIIKIIATAGTWWKSGVGGGRIFETCPEGGGRGGALVYGGGGLNLKGVLLIFCLFLLTSAFCFELLQYKSLLIASNILTKDNVGVCDSYPPFSWQCLYFNVVLYKYALWVVVTVFYLHCEFNISFPSVLKDLPLL